MRLRRCQELRHDFGYYGTVSLILACDIRWHDLQVILVVRDLSLHQLVPACLAIVWEIEQVYEVRFLSLHCCPAEVND